MKKILCALLALLLLIGCTFTFASCNTPNDQKPNDTQQGENEDDKKQEEGEDQKDIVIPEDYVVYDDGKISFAYPKNWTKQNGSVVILTGTNGNNITVVYEPKTNMYDDLTIEVCYNAGRQNLHDNRDRGCFRCEVSVDGTGDAQGC